MLSAFSEAATQLDIPQSVYSIPETQSSSERATMVYYFTSNVVDPPAFIYVGKDKVESQFNYVTIQN